MFMDKRSKELGAILLTNLVLNTQNLSRLNNRKMDLLGGGKFIEELSPNNLYSRLLASTKFDELSEDEKRKFLFLRKDAAVDDKENYNKIMKSFVKEAHKRTCGSLGVDETKIVYCDFRENPALYSTFASVYDYNNGNIYINSGLDYSKKSPSSFLEEINTRTRSHSIHKNIICAIENPDALSDKDYFLVLMTALKHYLYEYAKKSFDAQTYDTMLVLDYCTPESVEAVGYGFSQSRKQLQLAGLYGGEIRENLRQTEKDFYDLLQGELLDEMLANHEDMIDNFVHSELNERSGGLLGTILKGLEKQLASGYYNSLGAEMGKGEDVTSYLDKLQEEKLKNLGIDVDSDEWKEVMEMQKLQEESEGFDESFEDEDGEEFLDEELEEADEAEEEFDIDEEESNREPNLNKFRNVLPLEGKIDKLSKLPFEEEVEREQEKM